MVLTLLGRSETQGLEVRLKRQKKKLTHAEQI